MNEALAQVLTQAAATLLEEARKLVAPEVSPRDWIFGADSKGAQWVLMQAIFSQRDRERGLTPFNPSLLAGILGLAGGSFFPKSWRSHRRILDAATNGELNNGIGWPMPDGSPFRIYDYLDKSTEEKHAAVMWAWTCPKALEWRAHPDNLPVLPKGEPDPAPDLMSV